jgi:hypothetical protein
VPKRSPSAPDNFAVSNQLPGAPRSNTCTALHPAGTRGPSHQGGVTPQADHRTEPVGRGAIARGEFLETPARRLPLEEPVGDPHKGLAQQEAA